MSGVNVNINGGNNQNHFGNGDMNQFVQGENGEQWKHFIDEIAEQAPDEWDETVTDSNIQGQFESPKEMLAVATSQIEKDLRASKNFQAPNVDQAKKHTKEWKFRFSELAALGVKIGSKVGVATLKAFVNKSPVIAGLLALCEEIEVAAKSQDNGESNAE